MSVNSVGSQANSSSSSQETVDPIIEKIKRLTVEIKELDMVTIFQKRAEINRLSFDRRDPSPELKEAIEELQKAIAERIPSSLKSWSKL
jgi:hypothetical protein